MSTLETVRDTADTTVEQVTTVDTEPYTERAAAMLATAALWLGSASKFLFGMTGVAIRFVIENAYTMLRKLYNQTKFGVRVTIAIAALAAGCALLSMVADALSRRLSSE